MASICLYLQDPYNPLVEWEADLRDTDGLAFTFEVNDLSQLVSPKAPFAKGVVLAGTGRTQETLRHLSRNDTSPVEEILNKDIPARLLVDGVDIFKGSGVLQLVSIIHRPDGTVDYEADLTGGLYTWVAEASRMTWCDVALGDFIWDDVIPVNTWDRLGVLGTAYGWDYVGAAFFPVHYGFWSAGGTNVSRSDLRPHLYIRWMLTKAFEVMGWTLTGDYVDSDRFSSLVHLFQRGRWGVSQDLADSINGHSASQDILRRYTPAGSITPVTAGQYFLTNVTNSPHWASSTWTQPFAARVTLCFTIGPGMTVAQDNDWVLVINGTEVASTLTPYDFVLGMEICYETCLLAGDLIRWKVKSGSVDPLLPDYMDISAGAGNFTVTCEPTNTPCDGDVVYLCEAVDPDLKVLDVIMGVTHLEGLYWETNQATRTVTPYKPGERQALSPMRDDWTGRVDCGEDISVTLADQGCRNHRILFKEDSTDALLKWYEVENGQPLYSLTEVADASSICLTDNVNPTYAATWQVNEKRGINRAASSTGVQGGGTVFLPIWLSMSKQIPVPADFIAPDTDKLISWDFAPRIAIYQGLQDDTELGWFTPVGWNYDNEDGLGVVVQGLFPNAYLMDWWNGTREGIGYADIRLETQAPDLGPGLVIVAPGQESTSWEFILTANRSGRVLEGLLVFRNVQEISEVDFSVLKFIRHTSAGQAEYLLTEISDWNPQTRKAKVRLSLVR